MKFTEYFIKHKVVSIILNSMILVVGILALRNITIREYPNVQTPVLSINTAYPNASPELVESTITNILEDAASSITGVRSISSESSSGSSWILINLEENIDLEHAIIELKDAISQAKGELPDGLRDPIIQKGGFGGSFPFFCISVTSSEMNFGELTHYVKRYLKNNFRSVRGVGKTDIWGRPYTMKITLDQNKLYNYGINVSEISDALRKYNISLPVGKFRDNIPASLDGRLTSPKEFEDTYIATKTGKSIFLKDIATVELANDIKQTRTRVNGQTGVVIALERSIDANPIDVANDLRKEVEALQKLIPDHMKINIDIDQSVFIKSSLKNIYFSIFEAVILVLVIVFLFLGNLRATFIPLLTIPISLIGTIAVMLSFGMSINTLTLLAMVLSIGLVVDDAIVVLENITRHIEAGMKPLDAAIKGSSEIGFAIIAMTCTLASVYAPIAFVKGVIGGLFIEFAVTLAGSVILSGIVALTLSPMMCAYILKPHKVGVEETKIHRLLAKLEQSYSVLLASMMHRPKWIIGIIISSLIISWAVVNYTTHEIAPSEDRGAIGIFIPPVPGKNMDEMEFYAAKIEKIISKIPDKQSYLTFMGPWGVSCLAVLLDHDKRSRHQLEIKKSIEPEARDVPSVDAWPWDWSSALPGMDSVQMGNNLSFALSTTGTYEELAKYADQMTKALNATGKFIYTKHNVKFNTTEKKIELNDRKAAALQITPYVTAQTIEVFFSGNQFLKFSKDDILYPITIIGNTSPWSLNELYVIDPKNNKVSIGSFATMKEKVSMSMLPHYNQLRSATIEGVQIPIYSIESLIPIVESIARDILPESFRIKWTGEADITAMASGTMVLLFVMAIIFVYAILAIQFNNFFDPIIVMVTVPLACSGALLTNWVFGGSLNIYTQIGLVTLVGLITKHGILIVEFANTLVAAGEDITHAVSHSAALRLRPILMTTGAMILGAVPIVLSTGAGCEARRAIGVILVGGLSFGTFFTLFVLPKIYCWIKEMTHNNVTWMTHRSV